MTTVTLTGIQIGSPLGFMAALGLLRVLHEDHGLDVNLRWQDGRAVLGGIDTHALLALLAAHMRGRQQAPEFNFEVGTGSSKPVPVVHLREIRPADYRHAAATLADNPRALGFLAGFATDAVVTDKGFIARTAFDFSSARQELGKEFRNLAARLDPDRKRGRKEAPVEALWTHGLFGGPYAEQHSFGWDPATLMGHGQAAIAQRGRFVDHPVVAARGFPDRRSRAARPVRSGDFRAHPVFCKRRCLRPFAPYHIAAARHRRARLLPRQGSGHRVVGHAQPP